MEGEGEGEETVEQVHEITWPSSRGHAEPPTQILYSKDIFSYKLLIIRIIYKEIKLGEEGHRWKEE